ncbi:MAG: metallophosphoesterase family protein [Planctomycetes bacterium]|nr:metallophosphoesterase family protein [Planctomycetota bacterium]
MIAIISDIHSNQEALTAVLGDIRARDIEQVLVLGDVIGYGPDPEACLALIRAAHPLAVLMGNHEQALIEGCPDNMRAIARTPIDWTRERCSVEDLAWIADWPNLCEGEGFMAVHGSPRDPVLEYIMPLSIRRPEKMLEIFTIIGDRVCAVGHTHQPGIFTRGLEFIRARECKDGIYPCGGEPFIINVGSVGQPRDGDVRSSYAIYDGESVVFRRVEYDFTKTQEKIRAIECFEPFLAHRLEVGH